MKPNYRFKSIHCHLFPTLQWCIDKKQHLAAVLEEIKNSDVKGKHKCVCTWKMPMCCEVWKDAYRKAAEHAMKERMKEKAKEGKKSGVQNPAGEARIENDVRWYIARLRSIAGITFFVVVVVVHKCINVCVFLLRNFCTDCFVTIQQLYTMSCLHTKAIQMIY